MRILLISANRERMPYPVAPLGLAYIARALAQAGHDVQVTDLCFSADIAVDLKQALAAFTPDLVGISLRNLDNLTYPTSVSYLPDLDETVAIVRQHTAAPICHRRLRFFPGPPRPDAARESGFRRGG